MSGHECCRLKSVMPLHANTALPMQLCLSVVQMVIEVKCVRTHSWNLEELSCAHPLSMDAVAAISAATVKSGLKVPSCWKTRYTGI